MYREECQYGNKTVCATHYESVCQSEGTKPPRYKRNACRQVPREKCEDKKEKICKKVPEKKCEGKNEHFNHQYLISMCCVLFIEA